MSDQTQSAIKNRLLRALSPSDFALLGPHLEPMSTAVNQVLVSANVRIERLFFPEAGMASVVSEGSSKVEVGTIGREGLVGTAVLLDDDQSPFECFIQAPGSVLAIGTEPMLRACDQSRTLQKLLLRYTHSLLIQTAQTAYINAALDIEARLIRWLLMCQDRMGGDEIALTHEFLAIMLGVQRSSVSLSLQLLEGSGLIRTRRGRIEIRDRERMIAAVDKGYGIPEAAYDRLIGPEPCPAFS